jgi:hypothetical protein
MKDVSKNEVPIWVRYFGGHAVIKVPYSNAGQGVYTITSPQELKTFMALEHRYDKFIVQVRACARVRARPILKAPNALGCVRQSLIGSPKWCSIPRRGQFFHIGTVPDHKLDTYVSVRCRACANGDPFELTIPRAA